MDESLLSILHVDIKRIKELNEKVKILIKSLVPTSDDDVLLECSLTSSKLEIGLNKLKDDMNNYFRMVNDPDVDEISNISTIQLEAEENLSELKFKRNLAKAPENAKDRTIEGKLPKLSLPEFHGNILEWHQFWDQFESNIGNRNIADVDKLAYLKSLLKGDAAKVIDGLDMTNKNYQIAISILRDRYGRSTLVIDAHYAALTNLTLADNTTADCRRVLNDIERHLRILKSLGEDTSHGYLRYIVMEKFPEDMVYEVKRKIENKTIDDIRCELENIISAKEDSVRRNQSKESKDEGYTTGALHVRERRPYRESSNSMESRQRRSSDRNFTPVKRTYNEIIDSRISSGNATTSMEVKRQRVRCIFCGENHYNDECNKFITFQERKSQLRNRCYSCLGKGHGLKNCRRKMTCFFCKKYGLHNKSICPEKFKRKEETNQLHINSAGLTVLQTAVVHAQKDKDNTKKIKCRILLDSGSQRSYIDQKIAKELELKIHEECRLTIFTFGSKIPQEIESPITRLRIISRFGKTIPIDVNIVPMITQSVPHPTEDIVHWKDKFDLADDGSLSDRVDILIGNDYYFSLMSTEKVQIKENLYLVKSDIGWIFSGKTDSKSFNDLEMITYVQTNLDLKFNQPDLPLNDGNLKELWDLESIGIRDSPKENREDEAIRQFNETTEYINKRYYVSWPWIEYPPLLPTNFGLALGRLINIIKRFQDNDNLTSYDNTLKEQREMGIIEPVPDTTKLPDHPVHYLPHHGIKQKNKPMRIVYDASSKTKDNKSLNQCLYCGPMMLEDLTGLLLKFRCHSIGICADVEKAFLQIGLKEKDRDVTRFLWIRDINKPANEENLLHLRFCRVPFGIISSPFLLNATIKYHLKNSDSKQIQDLANDIYVDNLVTGVQSEGEAKELYKNSKEIFQELSMNLREWSSNSSELIKEIPDSSKDRIVKVLGLSWNTERDTLQLRFTNTNVRPNSKREVLKIVASAYDPCGFAVPSLLSAKVFLQDLWKEKLKWDTPLQETIIDKWENVNTDLEDIKNILIPRCYFKIFLHKDCRLHCFTDSSTLAYAAAVYITNGKEKNFVIGKSRLVPIKDREKFTIPRLELLGVLIGCRLINYVVRFLQLEISTQTLWTDSQIVIDWCKSDKLLPPFVSRRVEEIKKNKNLTIRYVPTELNPADVATRLARSAEEKERWLNGPQFILEDPSSWPTSTNGTTSLLVSGEGLTSENMEIEEQTANDTEPEHIQPEVLYTTIEEIKEIQKEYFPEELEGKTTSLKLNLGLFKDTHGILRCKGRFKNCNWSVNKKYPILIPKQSELTNHIIQKVHENNYHVGVSHTLSILRNDYWIPQGRAQVQRILKKCPHCVKHGGGPYKLPQPPALPSERVNYSKPFTYTGLDYLGPLFVQTEKGKEKRWICLFTCLAVRAIHLELVENLTAEECLLALRRFTAARGIPNTIISDNALQFKLTAEVLTYCRENQVQWKNIIQLAPWRGGFYERLMALVKNCLKRTLGKHLLRDSQMQTVLKEIEAILNTRPLTIVGSELEDVLKPSDFLSLGKCLELDFEEGDLKGTTTKVDLISGWRRGQRILEEYKNMFINQYLPSLRERYRHSLKQPRVTCNKKPEIGDIVQIKDDSKNRIDWKVGKIVCLIKDQDGVYRAAKVKVDKREFTRSIAHLYPLEIEEYEGDNLEPVRAPGKEPNYSYPLPLHRADGNSSETMSSDEVTLPSDKSNQLDQAISSENLKEFTLPGLDNISEPANDDVGDEISMRQHAHTGPSEVEGEEGNVKQRRRAATKALEKIRQWTRNLFTLF